MMLFASFGSGTSAADARVKLFPLDQVRLLDGPFKAAQEVDQRYLLAHDADRMLAPFRREAGLPAKAKPYGNWESSGLDGHTAGHYIAALAMMYASTGDVEMKRRLDYCVAELAECQKANGNGYVGGVPDGKALWTAVAAGQLKVNGFGLNDRWVPWYNIHKLYAGLRDAYLIGRNEQAKTVLIGMADWCDALLAGLSDEQVQRMLRAEHGGMNEVLADVSVITGDPKYLALAQRFSDRAILTPLAEGRDDLTGKHANTQIPKVIGFERIGALTGDARLARAAEFFWQNVTGKRSVAIGGNSVNEHFHRPDDFTSMMEDRTGPETCNTYNMLRLTEQLFERDPQSRYADFYERALFNHILSSQHPTRGGFVYFTPMRPRHYRVYSQPEQAFWCCVGTGLENHAKYGAFIYAHEANEALLVNLFMSSELRWPSRGLALRQQTNFPDEPRTRLTLSLDAPAEFALRLRRPEWLADVALKVAVNGKDHPVEAGGSGYDTVRRQWANGDVVEVQLPMRVAAESLPDGSDFVALRYGPIVLAAATGTDDLTGLFAGDGRGDHIAPGPMRPMHDAPVFVTQTPDQIAQYVVPVAGQPLTFTARDLVQPPAYKDLQLIPFFRIHESRYSIYWRVITPERLASERQRIEAEERERLRLERVTIDRVTPGEQQSEVDHRFIGDNTQTGSFRDRPWRDAKGWFSYELKRPGNERAELVVTYFGGDRDRRFDVLINDVKVADVNLDGRRGDAFVQDRYPLPKLDDAQPGKPLTVKFVAHAGSTAGGVYEVRLVRAGDGADAAR